MFLDIDVVEFNDASIPFTSILLNAAMVRQIQRVTTRTQERYAKHRAELIAQREDDPNVFVSDVEELPSGGAEVILISAQLGVYYTVTPFEEVRRQAQAINRRTNEAT